MLTHNIFYKIEIIQLLGFIIALLISYLSTPLIRSRAFKLGLLDKPSKRKIHEVPVPRLGGVSIYVSLFLTSLVFITVYWNYNACMTGAFSLLGIFAGGTIIFSLGLLDDIEPLPPPLKLMIQILASSIAWLLGIKILSIVNPFYHTDFYFFKLSVGDAGFHFDPFSSYVLTVIWLVGITNAINLIDGMDGLATGISLISAIAIWAVSIDYRINQPAAALMAATLAGGLLGFLRWNFNPARIFLGDSGAYLTGFVLACLTTVCAVKKVTLTIMTPALILIFALPILDTLLAIIRRIINRKSILEPDTKHLHHQILAFGLSQKLTAYIFYLISGLLGLWAAYLISVRASLRFIVLSGLVSTVVLFYTCVINWKHQKLFRNMFSKSK